jgi:hypothetical protein
VDEVEVIHIGLPGKVADEHHALLTVIVDVVHHIAPFVMFAGVIHTGLSAAAFGHLVILVTD